METRTVYRVETRRGEGAFSCGVYFYGRHNDDEFRAPWEEPRLQRRWDRGDLNDWVCGFQSLDEARRWFGPEEAEMLADEASAQITTWTVPRRAVAYGRDQVMFDRDLAHCTERRCVRDLYADPEPPRLAA